MQTLFQSQIVKMIHFKLFSLSWQLLQALSSAQRSLCSPAFFCRSLQMLLFVVHSKYSWSECLLLFVGNTHQRHYSCIVMFACYKLTSCREDLLQILLSVRQIRFNFLRELYLHLRLILQSNACVHHLHYYDDKSSSAAQDGTLYQHSMTMQEQTISRPYINPLSLCIS